MARNGWVLDSPDPGHDYGIDFFARHFSSGVATRYECKIQLKGTAKATKRSSTISNRLSTHGVVDWVDNQHLPVFLFVVDVENEKCYFVWIQQFVETKLADEKWRGRGSVTIQLPIENLLDTEGTFEKAAQFAYDIATSPATAIRKRQKLLESLDPRFRVAYKPDASGVGFEIFARSDNVTLSLSLSLDGDAATEKFSQLFDYGLPVEFCQSEISISGSPLFESLMADGVSIQIGEAVPAMLNCERITSGGATSGTMLFTHGNVRLSKKELRFYGQTSEGCYEITYRVALDDQGKPNGAANVHIVNHLSRWEGKPVAIVPYLDQFCRFACDAPDSTLRFSISTSGVTIFSVTVTSDQAFAPLHGFGAKLTTWKKLKELSVKCRQDLAMQTSLTSEQIRQVNKWHRLFCTSERIPATGMSVSLDATADQVLSIYERQKSERNRLGNVKYIEASRVLEVPGGSLVLPPHEINITKMKFSTPITPLAKRAKRAGAGETFRLTLKGTRKSVFSSDML